MFVAAEFAIIAVRPSRIEQLVRSGNRAAGWVHKVLDSRTQTDRYVATAQLGITIASLGLGMYAEPAIAHLLEVPLHDWLGLQGAIVHTISFIVALTLVTYLHVVIGEMVPKSLALQGAERTVLFLVGPMRISGALFAYPVRFLNSIGLFALKVFRIPPPGKGSRLYSPDELELLVEESANEGLLDEYEQMLVGNILEFAQERVGQVMRPRTLMTAVPTTVGEQEMLELIATVPYNRLPVYGKSIDDIVGMIHLKDLIRQQLHGEAFDLDALLRPVTFVPETAPVKALLADLRQKQGQMAIAIDEHGGTVGLVTLEDLLEEIVGDVRDEFDHEDAPLALVAPGQLVAQGAASLDSLASYLPLPDLEHDVHTIGGLVWAELGRRPRVGSEITIDDVTFRVDAVDGLSVTEVTIQFPPPGAKGSDDTLD